MSLDVLTLQLGAHYRVQFIDSDGDVSEGVGRYIGNGIAPPFIIKPNFQWDILMASAEAIHPEKIVTLWRTDANLRKPQGLPVEELVYRKFTEHAAEVPAQVDIKFPEITDEMVELFKALWEKAHMDGKAGNRVRTALEGVRAIYTGEGSG